MHVVSRDDHVTVGATGGPSPRASVGRRVGEFYGIASGEEIGRGPGGHPVLQRLLSHRDGMDQEPRIYRGEGRSIMIGLAFIMDEVRTILGYLEGDDDEEEEEGVSDP